MMTRCINVPTTKRTESGILTYYTTLASIILYLDTQQDYCINVILKQPAKEI